MLRASRFAPVALAAALLLTACSGDEPSDDDGAGPDRGVVEEGLAALFAGDHATERDGESGACFAEELVDRAGVERLTEAGVLADDGRVVEALPTFDEETAGLWVDAQLACVDYVEESTEALAAQTKGALDREVYAACLRDAITDGAIREAMVATLMGRFDAPAVTTLSDAQVGCRGSAT